MGCYHPAEAGCPRGSPLSVPAQAAERARRPWSQPKTNCRFLAVRSAGSSEWNAICLR